ncbi:MAG: hypothetical protein KBT88_13260 [Gammaproteobacteria bacterium]|nr:hypothetical protein [Gammaproteobacteria bacterium]MBQ0840746.1 hypothetical protein [Gammaproteobacteria bacterium]
MKLLSIITLSITTFLLSSNLLAAQSSHYYPDFKDRFSRGFSYDPRPGNTVDDLADTSSECQPGDIANDQPLELNLSFGPQSYDSPMLAVNAYLPIKIIASEHFDLGFEVIDHYEEAYNYLVAPTGDYRWGDYVIELEKPARFNSRKTTYATITVSINYIEADDGYRATGFELRANTVY